MNEFEIVYYTCQNCDERMGIVYEDDDLRIQGKYCPACVATPLYKNAKINEYLETMLSEHNLTVKEALKTYFDYKDSDVEQMSDANAMATFKQNLKTAIYTHQNCPDNAYEMVEMYVKTLEENFIIMKFYSDTERCITDKE